MEVISELHYYYTLHIYRSTGSLFQPEVLEILVKNGADLDAKTRNGETAFGNYCHVPLLIMIGTILL